MTRFALFPINIRQNPIPSASAVTLHQVLIKPQYTGKSLGVFGEWKKNGAKIQTDDSCGRKRLDWKLSACNNIVICSRQEANFITLCMSVYFLFFNITLCLRHTLLQFIGNIIILWRNYLQSNCILNNMSIHTWLWSRGRKKFRLRLFYIILYFTATTLCTECKV